MSTLDCLFADGGGIKSVVIKVEGKMAYGWAKSENGVHRLVRISPFDSNAKRHTSFASVSVTPVLNDDLEIVINEKDIRIDTFRASGAGGQHVNKTESAVRITHVPSGIVVACQNSRSQHSNKSAAYEMLKSKLCAVEIQKKEEKIAKERGEKGHIGWGNQIRSYVMHPYQMVKDLRSKFSVGNVDSIMNGNIDHIILSVLSMKSGS